MNVINQGDLFKAFVISIKASIAKVWFFSISSKRKGSVETYCEPYQTSKLEHFLKKVDE